MDNSVNFSIWQRLGGVLTASAFMAALAASPLQGTERAERLHTLTGHDEGVLDLDWSPDGSRLVSGSEDGSVRSWDVLGGEAHKRVARFGKAVHGVDFTPDGQSVVFGGEKNELQFYDVNSGKNVREIEELPGPQRALEVSPDGRFIATGGFDSTLTLWIGHEEQPLHVIDAHEAPITALSFSPDGEFLCSADESGSLRVWEVLSGYLVFSVKLNGPIWDLDFAPDGQHVAAAGDDIKIIELRSSTIVQSLAGQGPVHAVAWSPSGKLLASGGADRVARVWAVTTGRVVDVLDAQDGEIRSLAFSPDGNKLATGSSEYANPDGKGREIGENSIVVWDISEIYSDGRIARYVERQLYHWQRKGEFEKMSDYQRRLATIEAEAGKLFAKAFRMYADEVKETATISAYDADNEQFRVDIPTIGEFMVRVPIEKAETFKKRFHEVVYRNFIVEPEIRVPHQSKFSLKRVELYLPSAKQSFFFERAE